MKFAGVDIETPNLQPYKGTIWMVSITELLRGRKKTYVIQDCNGIKKCPPELRKILEDEDICKIIHSSQFDCPYMELNWGVKTRNLWDSELSETCVVGLKPAVKKNKNGEVTPGSYDEKMMIKFGTKLKYVLPRYGLPMLDKSGVQAFINRPKGKPFNKKDVGYAEEDTRWLLELQVAQEKVLIRDKQLEVALLENKAAERYHDMKVRGIGFDPDIWREVYADTLKNHKQRIGKLPKTVSNWNSPKQVKEFFYKRGIDIPSFDDLDMVYLKTRNPILGDFIASREYSTAISRYGLNWFDKGFIDDDGRIRCNITQIINTGRNSMSDPNLQQLPGSGNSDPLRLKVLKLVTGDGKKMPQHRRAFVPRPGHVFVIGDFSGQEIGVMAAASNEKLWIDAMLRGDDVHGLTASIIDPIDWRQATEKGCKFPKKCQCKNHKALREPAKINNFRLAYGGGVESFAAYMGWEMERASMYLGKHRRAIPNLTKYLERNGVEAVATGLSYSADPYRRRRVLLGDVEWRVRNQGKNNPIQSSGANMLKLALISLPWDYAVVLVIHDEIILEVPIAKANKAMHVLKTVMEKSADYITGIQGLVRVEPKIQMNIMKDQPTTVKKKEFLAGTHYMEKLAA